MRKQRASKIDALWWFLAALLLLWWIAVEAEAVTTQPGECSLTAMASLKVAQTEHAKAGDRHSRHFVQLSRYLWEQAQGDKARFLRWYREACEVKRAPKYYRLVNGTVGREV